MHEFAIVENLLREARKHCEPAHLRVAIGELTGMTREEFEGVFRTACDCGITTEYEKGKVRCLSPGCGFEGEPKILAKLHTYCLIECPECGGRKLKVLSGDKMILRSMRAKSGKEDIDVNHKVDSASEPHTHSH